MSKATAETRVEPLRYQGSTERSLDEVLLDVDIAITNHNYRITSRNRIGAAIAERLGESFPAADVIQFCNLEYARRLLEIDPGFIVYMPCQVAVYQVDASIVVSTWLLPGLPPPADEIGASINAVLRDIVDYATVQTPAHLSWRPVQPARPG